MRNTFSAPTSGDLSRAYRRFAGRHNFGNEEVAGCGQSHYAALLSCPSAPSSLLPTWARMCWWEPRRPQHPGDLRRDSASMRHLTHLTAAKPARRVIIPVCRTAVSIATVLHPRTPWSASRSLHPDALGSNASTRLMRILLSQPESRPWLRLGLVPPEPAHERQESLKWLLRAGSGRWDCAFRGRAGAKRPFFQHMVCGTMQVTPSLVWHLCEA